MALGRYGPEGFTYPGGRPAAYLAIAVMKRGTQEPALLFDDIGGVQPVPNPILCDEEGNLTFCAEDGDYDLYPSFGGFLEISIIGGGVGPPGPPGPPGPAGSKRWYGAGPPGTIVGAQPNDEYVDLTNGDLYLNS